MSLGYDEQAWSLLLGDVPLDRRPVYYSGEGSLVTIAPPGSGKTQCHVLPNVIAWRGPAIVLDVTGELWRSTSRQRKAYGPIYRIDLDHIEESDCYNPVMTIRRDARYVWEDALSFAHLLHIKRSGDGGNPFFENSAITLIAAAACYVVMYRPEEERNFATLLSIVSGGAWDSFLKEAASKTDIPGLQNEAAMLRGADERTRSNIRSSAKVDLNALEGYGVSRITRISDWDPQWIREDNATIYICFSLEKLETYAGFVRLIVGQQVRALLQKPIDRGTAAWVQFFLDELPQLQKMDIIRQALDAGRNYNVRLWMFTQYQSQLEAAYGEGLARGMIGACGVRAFMNPPLFDGTSEMISKALGTEINPYDGSRRPAVEPHMLAGPEFKHDVMVFPAGANPVRLRKHYFFQDPYLTSMQGESA